MMHGRCFLQPASIKFAFKIITMPGQPSWYHFVMIISLRYFIVAGIAFLIWYKLLGKKIFYKKIQARFPKNKDYQREIFYSLITIAVFASAPVLLLQTSFRKFTQYYTHINENGMLYFWLAFPLTFIIHDAYFYWIHRLMHHPKLFRYMHVIHHRSVNPSPWAAFSFQPFEAIVEAGIFAVLIIVMPIHFWHLFVFFLVMIVYNVYGHLGWELYPKNFSRHWLGKWVNTSVNHNQHHQFFKGNYGLYFLFWDRWMNTLRSDYEDQFELVQTRTKTRKV